MNEMIQTTIDGMLSSFDYIQVSDESIRAEIEAYRLELQQLGERSSDPGSFMADMQSSGLMDKQTNLITRAASGDSGAAMPVSDSSESKTPVAGAPDNDWMPPEKLPTVKEFLEQYRPGAEAAKKHGYQFRAVAAYEKIFSIADRTDDLLENNIILEEEGHLRAIAAEASYDINKLAYDTQDPNNIAARNQFKRLMDLAESYQTDEELYYKTDLLVQENLQEQSRFESRMLMAITLSNVLLGYIKSKQNAWMDINQFGGGIYCST